MHSSSTRSSPPEASWHRRLVALLVSAVCLVAALAAASHHPLAPLAALGLCGLGFVLALAWPSACLVAVPGLLPLAGLAPWTGWMTVEEFDLLVLSLAAGAYARMALKPRATLPGGFERWGKVPLSNWLVLLLMACSVALSLQRGVADAGGLVWGWTQGYRESMNSLRLVKPLLVALLLLPLWRESLAVLGDKAARRLSGGMALGLFLVSLVCLWERVTFPGLLNFSTDYRTTGLFWEMHVGGAALDAFLSMTMPFAMYHALQARTPREWVVAAGVVLLGGYAALTTFSRIVFLAVPMALAVMVVLRQLQQARQHKAASRMAGADAQTARPELALGWTFALVLLFAVGTLLSFSTSGYRGMLALLGNMTLLLMLGPQLRGLRMAASVAAIGAGVLLSGVVVACALWVPKGAYLADGAVLLGAGGLLLLGAIKKDLPGPWRAAALAGYVAALSGTAAVCANWGGEPALWGVLPVLVAFAAALAACAFSARLWPQRVQWQMGQVALLGVTALVVGIFGGGAYMTERVEATSSDRDGRLSHWKLVLGHLHSAGDIALGRGLGRFLDGYAIDAPNGMRPGDYRLTTEGGTPVLKLIAGSHIQGWGEMLRLSQRVARPSGPVVLHAKVRSAVPVRLHAEVCNKHLLYDGNCWTEAFRQEPANARPNEWQTLDIKLKGDVESAGPWYAPVPTVFSLATDQPTQPLEIASVSLTDEQGREYLVNGNFQDGLTRWLCSSDRYHMPWHAKNMIVHVLFEQGLLGLLALLGLSAAAAWRVSVGQARDHVLAPPIAAAIAGFWVVGAIDSLLDIPRVAALFLWLAVIGLSLPSQRREHRRRSSAPVATSPRPTSPRTTSHPAHSNA